MKKRAAKYNSPLIAKLMEERDPKQTERVKKRMKLAAKIEDGIKAKRWKKKDLAEALNKQPSEITKWLSGTHNFTTDTLFEIEDILDINLISLSDQKPEQVTNFFITVSQKPEKAPPDCVILGDPDELIPYLSSNFKA
jgi:ribosome-binding protein aMBF1 (putative translation factor)